jgi:hypothetical protein
MKGNKRNMAEEEKYLKRMIELKGENGTNLMRFPWGNDWYAIIRTPDLKHKLYIFNEDFPNGKHI